MPPDGPRCRPHHHGRRGPGAVPDRIIDRNPQPRARRPDRAAQAAGAATRGSRSKSFRGRSRIIWRSMTAWPATSAWRSCYGFWGPSSAPSFRPLPWRPCMTLARGGAARSSSPPMAQLEPELRARFSPSGWRISWRPIAVLRARTGRRRSRHPSGAGRAVGAAGDRGDASFRQLASQRCLVREGLQGRAAGGGEATAAPVAEHGYMPAH